MSQFGAVDRRAMLATGLGVVAAASPAAAASRPSEGKASPAGLSVNAGVFGIEPGATNDQSQRFQTAIDQSAAKGLTLLLPPGNYVAGNLVLRPGARITGAAGRSTISYSGAGSLFTAWGSQGIRLSGLVLDGHLRPFDYARASALVVLDDGSDVVLSDLVIERSSANAIALTKVGGVVRDVAIRGAVSAAIMSMDARGLEISGNRIADCSDNGILIWRSTQGADATLVTGNRIQRIANKSGGSGEFGNGINIYRAGNVIVSGNTIEDCAYTAIRGNTASNLQMIGNSAHRSGEVALYAEFGFEGAIIANNLIDGAATGIAVTNFNEGGRLAVVQGNIVRNLFRREYEKTDKRGEGIGVEADAVVANNVIEGAPTAGLQIGWGKYMREVVVTGNLIRKSRIGIAVTGDPQAGACLLANNMITGARDGAIRSMDHATPEGPDLVTDKAARNINVSGNVVA